MPYQIDKQSYVIKIEGITEEIRQWIIALEQVITGGSYFHELEEDLNNLEDIIQPEQFNFPPYERIYYTHNSILYGLNVSFSQRPPLFPLMEQHFEAARKLVEKG